MVGYDPTEQAAMETALAQSQAAAESAKDVVEEVITGEE
jgi:hypothetical protein